jgi:putative inorganic carbon (HCO3(-)) transporter
MGPLAKIQPIACRLAQVEIWVVLAVSLAALVRTELLPAAVITAAFFWLVRYAAYGRLSLRTPLDWSLLLLLLAAAVSIQVSVFPEITRPQVFRLLLGIAIFYALANWCNSPRRMRIAVLGLILAGLLLALGAPFIVAWATQKVPFIPSTFYRGFSLLVSDTVHPNVIAGSLVLLLPLALAWLVFAWNDSTRYERILAGMASLFISIALVLTQSRGAWIAYGAAIIVLPALRWRWGWAILLLALVAFIPMIYVLGFTPLLELLAPGGAVGGIGERLEVWSRAIFMIQDFPFTGIGMGSFEKLADTLYPLFLVAPGKIAHSHNLFLQVAVDLGIPGLVAWLAAFLVTCQSSWMVYQAGRSANENYLAALGAGLLCAQVALAVHGLTDAVSWGVVRSAPLVWALWGVAASGLILVVQVKPPRQVPPPPPALPA